MAGRRPGRRYRLGVTPSVAARALFATTAALVLVGIVIDWAVVVDATDGYFSTPAARVFNMFCYFTVQSNLIVGVTCLLLALRLDRRSELFGVFRIAGVIDIAITPAMRNTPNKIGRAHV